MNGVPIAQLGRGDVVRTPTGAEARVVRIEPPHAVLAYVATAQEVSVHHDLLTMVRPVPRVSSNTLFLRNGRPLRSTQAGGV